LLRYYSPPKARRKQRRERVLRLASTIAAVHPQTLDGRRSWWISPVVDNLINY